jgi:formate dehydrogenase assembly factor FdhD
MTKDYEYLIGIIRDMDVASIEQDEEQKEIENDIAFLLKKRIEIDQKIEGSYGCFVCATNNIYDRFRIERARLIDERQAIENLIEAFRKKENKS